MIAHPVEEYYFRYRGSSRRRLFLETDFEESRVVALVLLCTHVLELYKFNICCIKVNYTLLKLWYIVGMFMSIVLWAQVAVFTHVMSDDVDD